MCIPTPLNTVISITSNIIRTMTSTISSRPPVPGSASSSKSLDEKSKSSSTPRNPISLRLYKILGTNYDDPATREALHTLSELYKSPETSMGKNLIHDSKTENEEALNKDHLDHHTPDKHPYVSSGIASRARKSIRRDAELKLAQGSRQFVRAFQEVDKVSP